MTLGEKLKQARQEAGMSQKALCGDRITRNMLSQIEHGAASPSLDTMVYLASRLDRPVSWFLEEGVASSSNQGAMEAARELYDLGKPELALEALEAYQGPDPVFDREKGLLTVLCRLGQAERLLDTGRERYAQQLLEELSTEGVYCREALEGKRLRLLARMRAVALPPLDEELLLRARQAWQAGEDARAERLLNAVENQDSPAFHYLRGLVCHRQRNYVQALEHLQKAESTAPEKTLPLLEDCAKELGDYQLAYGYACKRRERGRQEDPSKSLPLDPLSF